MINQVDYLRRIHFDVWQNQYNIVKLKNKKKKNGEKINKRTMSGHTKEKALDLATVGIGGKYTQKRSQIKSLSCPHSRSRE